MSTGLQREALDFNRRHRPGTGDMDLVLGCFGPRLTFRTGREDDTQPDIILFAGYLRLATEGPVR